MDVTDVPQGVYTIPEAAALLKVSRATIYNLLKAGSLEKVSVGNKMRIPGRSLRKFLGEL